MGCSGDASTWEFGAASWPGGEAPRWGPLALGGLEVEGVTAQAQNTSTALEIEHSESLTPDPTTATPRSSHILEQPARGAPSSARRP